MAAPRPVADWLGRWSPFAPAKLPDHIVATEVRAVADPVHANQRVEKFFAIFVPDTHATTPNSEPAEAVGVGPAPAPSPWAALVKAPGLTVVRVRPQLLEEIGPDVLARVRVSSDTADHLDRLRVAFTDKLTLDYTYDRRGSAMGHLVTEIDVAREAQIHQVIAMCNGDVVVHDGVLRRTSAPSTGAAQGPGPGQATVTSAVSNFVAGSMLASMHGAQLFLAAPQRKLRFDELFLCALGTSSVCVDAEHLIVSNKLLAGVIGRGRVRVRAQELGAGQLHLAAIVGGSVLLTAPVAFYAGAISAFLQGDGHVRVAAPRGAVLAPCILQDMHVGRSATVDLADVPSSKTAVALGRPANGVARIHAPREMLAIDCPARVGHGAAVQHIGALPANVVQTHARALLTELSDESLARARAEGATTRGEDGTSVVPTIEAAFETPRALAKPREGWFLPFLAPMVRSFLPF